MASLTLMTINDPIIFPAKGNLSDLYFDGFSLKEICYTHIFLGFTASTSHHLPMRTVVQSFNTFLDTNPGNLTHDQLATALGAENNRRVREMFYHGFGNQEYLRASTAAAAGALPELLHERGIGGMAGVFWGMTVAVTVMMGLRLWARNVLGVGVLVHDWVMVAGYLMTLAYNILAYLHAQVLIPCMTLWDMSWNIYALSQLYQTLLSLLYPLPLFFIKTSLLLFYLYLCPSYHSETRSVMRTSIFVTFFFILATTISNFFIVLFQCERIAYWEEDVKTYCRYDVRMAQVVIGAFAVVTDIVVWLMPLPLVWKLDLGMREKFLAVLTFGLGAVACVVSAFRLRAIQLYNYNVDGKQMSVHVSMLAVTELSLAIMCASAPAIRALIIHYAPRILNQYSMSGKEAAFSIKSCADDGEVVEVGNGGEVVGGQGRLVIEHTQHDRVRRGMVQHIGELQSTR